MFDWVRSLFSAIRVPRHGDDDGHTPALLRLPRELVDIIVEFLDLSEAACLSVCCRHMYQMLGKDQHCLLHQSLRHGDQRKEFLQRLARDNPTLFFCHSCSRLHPVGSVGLPLSGDCRSPLRCMNLADSREVPFRSFDMYGDRPSYRLRFSHIQLVMARYRNGPKYGIPMSRLAITEVRRVKRHSVWCVLNVEPRVIDDQLFLRVQHWIVFDQDQQPNFHRLHGPSICSHISRDGIKYEGSTASDMLRCQVRHIATRATCPTCSVLYRCNDCAVEFEADTMWLDDRRVAVAITKWLNLGYGDSSADPKWRRHLMVTFEGRPVATAGDSFGSRGVFEEYAGKSQEAGVRKIATLLRAKSLCTELHHVSQDIWRDMI